jgi:hypothetical protein
MESYKSSPNIPKYALLQFLVLLRLITYFLPVFHFSSFHTKSTERGFVWTDNGMCIQSFWEITFRFVSIYTLYYISPKLICIIFSETTASIK